MILILSLLSNAGTSDACMSNSSAFTCLLMALVKPMFYEHFWYGLMVEIKGSHVGHTRHYFLDWFPIDGERVASFYQFPVPVSDVKWAGNEMAFAGSTCLSTINSTSLSFGN